MNQYAFIVDFSKNAKKDKLFNQILFCSCGNKQKTKITVKRIILKNSESLFEDKYSIEEIVCSNCKQKYDVTNNVYGIKFGQNLLVECSYHKEQITINKKTIKILRKNKLYFFFDIVKQELQSFNLEDFIIFDDSNKEIRLFSDESKLNLNIFDTSYELRNENLLNGEKYNSKQIKFKKYDLNEKNFFSSFFAFDEIVNYKNLEQCFEFFDDLLKNTYDYESLIKEKFISNFMVSSKIFEINEKDRLNFYINQKDPFGSNKLIRKKLNVGDYLNKLVKLSDITSFFISFPPISSLYKTKGLDFLIKSINKELFCPAPVLLINNSTNSAKILELCCKFYYNNSLFDNKTKKDLEKKDFKLSPLLIKNIHDPEDVLIIYQFFISQNISKQEIEHLFTKFSNNDVIEVMSKMSSGINHRNIKIELKHITHIIKSKLFKSSEDWLSIYYDTINSLKLIVEILENSKKNSIKSKKYINLSKISENKLFDCKNFEKLRELHDEMFAVYRAIEDENKDELFRNVVKNHKKLNTKIDYFEFVVIPNLKELSKEGLIMKHCIYTYLNDILNGNYIAIRVKDTISKEKATLGIKIQNKTLYLQQLKGYENSRATSLLINSVLKFCQDFKIEIESGHLHKTDIQPNVNLIKRMKNYLSESEALEIRKKLNCDKKN